MKPVNAIKEIRDEMIADAKAKAEEMAKAAVRAEAEAMYKLATKGMKREEIAALFDCGVATVHRRIRLHTEENNIARGAGGKLIRERSECGKLIKAHKEEAVYKAPDKAVIAEGWKNNEEEEGPIFYSYDRWNFDLNMMNTQIISNWIKLVKANRRNDYKALCKAHPEHHKAINYFRLLNKRLGGVKMRKAGPDALTNYRDKLLKLAPEERDNILNHMRKLNAICNCEHLKGFLNVIA
ncbi:TPA: hypothetical protein ACF23I_004540 [Escherichia coli]